MSSEGNISSTMEVGAIKSNSPNHIIGFASNSSDVIRGVVFNRSELYRENNFNFSECIGEVSLEHFVLELGIFCENGKVIQGKTMTNIKEREETI